MPERAWDLLLVCSLLATAAAYFELALGGGVIQSEYYATLHLGTPPRPFVLAIDTGSHTLAVNCNQCADCQAHVHPPYAPEQSTSAVSIACVPGG
jgi:hypothetical protein